FGERAVPAHEDLDFVGTIGLLYGHANVLEGTGGSQSKFVTGFGFPGGGEVCGAYGGLALAAFGVKDENCIFVFHEMTSWLNRLGGSQEKFARGTEKIDGATRRLCQPGQSMHLPVM